MSDGDWRCPRCGLISPTRVTSDEMCDTCNVPVYWDDGTDPRDAEIARLREERDKAHACIEQIERQKMHMESRLARLEAAAGNVVVAKRGVFDSTAEEIRSEVFTAVDQLAEALRLDAAIAEKEAGRG